MTFTDGMKTSATAEWGTPQKLFDDLNAEFRFNLDVCSTDENAKCYLHWTEESDGLSKRWAPFRCWMNPPYGRDIRTWVRKAYLESLRGATVVCLVPSRTDTSWWHDYCMRGEIRFIRGRLRFVDENGEPGGSAPFPSAIVIFRPGGQPPTTQEQFDL